MTLHRAWIAPLLMLWTSTLTLTLHAQSLTHVVKFEVTDWPAVVSARLVQPLFDSKVPLISDLMSL